MNIATNIENWMLIDGYDNYEVSSFGRVRNNITRRILKQGNIGRYYQVGLCKNNIRRYLLVHRLVADAFCDKEQDYNIIDHIDRNGYNNHYTNLRWCDNSINMKNKNIHHNNTSGCKGVCFDKTNNKWKTQWSIDGKVKSKYFIDKDEAIEFRQAMELLNDYK
jgi:hypothetical protein